MLFRAVIVPFAVLLALTSCAPEPENAPAASPTPSVTTPTPSATASAPPVAPALQLPGTCADLVPLATIHTQFWTNFEPIAFTPSAGEPDAFSFAARNGLTCLWGIPSSDAGAVTVYVAERATATDQQQADAWIAAGYSDCAPFLDACYYEDVLDEVGEYLVVHALVEGFEMRVHATSASLSPLLAVASTAATSMGYV